MEQCSHVINYWIFEWKWSLQSLVWFKNQRNDPKTYFVHTTKIAIFVQRTHYKLSCMNGKSWKKSKIAIREIQRNGSDSNQRPSDSRRTMDFFLGKYIILNYRYIRYQPMKHSYGKIICFQNFPFGKGLWLTYRYLTNEVLKWP